MTTPDVVSVLIAAGILMAAAGPFLLERLLTRRGSSRLRLAEERQAEQQQGFTGGCGRVRRATAWDVHDAQARLARTAWRARIITRPRDCGERREARQALRRLMAAPRRQRPRMCARPLPANWWPTAPKSLPVPEGMTPMRSILNELRGAL